MPAFLFLAPVAVAAAVRSDGRARVRLLSATVASARYWDPPRRRHQVERIVRDERGHPLLLRLTEHE